MAAVMMAPPGLDEVATDAGSTTASSTEVPDPQAASASKTSAALPDAGEVHLAEMLATMDTHLHCLRATQQRLVNLVELACRQALCNRFGRLVLVGSVALCAETPGSDVDVVCFTRNPDADPDAPTIPPGENPVEMQTRREQLRKVMQHLQFFIGVNYMTEGLRGYSIEFLEDARVPVLRLSWGLPEQAIAIDLLMDQRRPLEHVRWFQAVQACPSEKWLREPKQLSKTPLVTVLLRCVKWWLRQRQIPGTKEGGLPTISWLLLALNTFFLPETQNEVGTGEKPEMAALAAALLAFFRQYSSPGSLHGVLRFGSDSITNRKPSRDFRPTATKCDSPWADLVVLDPVVSDQDINLVPTITPATQLLVVHELQRAAQCLEAIAPSSSSLSTPRDTIDAVAEHQAVMYEIEGQTQTSSGSSSSNTDTEALFEGLPLLKNSLPSSTQDSIGALMLQGDPTKGVGTLEVVVIEKIVSRCGWSARFLHRNDQSSEIHARLCEVTEVIDGKTGESLVTCQPRKDGLVVLCPCHFICMLELERNHAEGCKYKLCEEDRDRFRSMRPILLQLRTHGRALGDLNSPQHKEVDKKFKQAPMESHRPRRRTRPSKKPQHG